MIRYDAILVVWPVAMFWDLLIGDGTVTAQDALILLWGAVFADWLRQRVVGPLWRWLKPAFRRTEP